MLDAVEQRHQQRAAQHRGREPLERVGQLGRLHGHEAGVEADALGPLPGAHHGWDGVLVLDGNVGIGGDPLLLLCRVRDLLRPTGVLLLELDPQDVTDRGPARLCAGPVSSSPFPWARLGAGGLPAVARCSDPAVLDTWSSAGRSFALLSPATG